MRASTTARRLLRWAARCADRRTNPFQPVRPLAVALWGDEWFAHGAISCHFQQMVVEGEEVQATLTTDGPRGARIEAHKADNSPVLIGTASIGPDHTPTNSTPAAPPKATPGSCS